MLVPIWKAKVTPDARLVMEPAEADQRRRFLESLKGKDVEVVVRRRRQDPTLEQERFLRGVVLPILMEHFGYLTTDEMLKETVGHCFGWKPHRPDQEWEPKRDYGSLSKEEKTRFIDWVCTWAVVEHGVVIPDPSRVQIV